MILPAHNGHKGQSSHHHASRNQACNPFHPVNQKDFIVSILLSWVPLKMYGVFSPWCGLIATYVASCSSSVGDVANILEGGVEVTGFTGTVPPPQQCRGRRKGGREVTNKLRTRVSAVACSFLVRSSWFFVRLGAVPSFSPIATPMA